MDTERFLVTGALGCIGAWAVKQLVDEGVPVWTYDLPGDPHRLRLIMNDEALARVHFVTGDITDAASFERTVAENGITHLVHLAALQVPFVRADPIQGARVNVVGSTIVCETAKRHPDHVRGLAYASSAAVYGPLDLYPAGPLAHTAPQHPMNLYGVFKQANEGTARIYWQDYGLHSIGLRPYVVYGPGRDQGMTSTPTKGMLAAALGRPYQISFGGTVVYQHAADAAAVFVRAARAAATCPDAPVFNLGGSTAHMAEIIQAIEAAAPDMAGKITFNPAPLALPEQIDGQPLEAVIGRIPWLPLAEGVRQTIAQFQSAAAVGRLNVERALA
jgi:nucleoside-diphosphate-sugar epimerase